MPKKALLHIAVEFGPIVIFFVASELVSFILATSLFVIATTISLITSIVLEKRIALFPLVVAASVISFGILTVVFNNPFFIIFKDTLYNGLFALAIGTGFLFQKNILKILFGKTFAMTDHGWKILSIRWMTLFVFLALSNEITRVMLSPEKWVIYKAATTTITIMFALYQFTLSRKERLPEATEWGLRN
jgi:intracellular septation protein